MGWTEERVELLKKLWADGLSASQIAAQLGGVTRNAVIGKVHRLGLSGRAKSPSSMVPRARKPRPASHSMRPRMRYHGNAALLPAMSNGASRWSNETDSLNRSISSAGPAVKRPPQDTLEGLAMMSAEHTGRRDGAQRESERWSALTPTRWIEAWRPEAR